jgi:ABC-2 type transport system ATP-binding protein
VPEVQETTTHKAVSTKLSPRSTPTMIAVRRATKRYGSTLAADQVSFEVAAGEIVGFLGPNGAGKSTVLKMISTWLPPTSGTVEVAGFDVQRSPLAVRRMLGYLPEHNAMYETMRVDRFLRFMGRVRNLDGAHLTERIDWVVGKCTLHDVLGKRINQCSKGYRQRIGLAASLLHDPKVILLDEPTHGLDPLQVVAFRDFIRELQTDRAILFSSHILAEVMAICERVLIINHGKLLADTTVAKLRERAEADHCTVEQAVLNIVQREQKP